MNTNANQRHILLIIGGGIAAYKACELIRLIRKAGMSVKCVLTKGGAHFVTPMTLAALSENEVYETLWDLKNETEMGHIQLSREADLVVVCPATADLIAKMAGGIADDMATTLLLATDKPVMAVPAMNVRMWLHAATQRNLAQLKADGLHVMQPDDGEMACGEFGPGRLPEPEAILREIQTLLAAEAKAGEPLSIPYQEKGSPVIEPLEISGPGPLAGKHVLVTAGPTHEPIDPVRYIANRSSGRQGYAIAAAAAEAGATVTLVSGPVQLATPAGVTRIDVQTAREMLAAVESALPADIAFMVAAVADWHVNAADQKIKKDGSGKVPPLSLSENPDILATLGKSKKRPKLLIGFAAETEKVLDHAKAKLAKKGCDWIVANDVSGDVMGGTANSVHIVTKDDIESWEQMPKDKVADKLVERAAASLKKV